MLPNVVSNTVLRARVFTAISFNNYHNCLTNDFDSAEMQPWPASALLLAFFVIHSVYIAFAFHLASRRSVMFNLFKQKAKQREEERKKKL